jgi:hypothetical protein
VCSFFVSPCLWLTVTAAARRDAPMYGQSTDGLPAGGRVYNAIIADERVEKCLLTTAALKARDSLFVPLSKTEPRRFSRHVRASLLHMRDRWLTRAPGWCRVTLPRARPCLARAS